MQTPIVAACLLFGIVFSAGLFHFVPILSRSSNKNYKFVSDEELMKISQSLFDEDKNDLLSHIKINFQGYLNSSKVTEDRAPDVLLTVDDAVNQLETISKMKLLYDNFEANSSINEEFTQEEETEQSDLITTLLQTSVMKLAMEFLVLQGSVSPEYQDHYDMIKTLWFDFYPRNKNTTSTSSGFEHIFLSEVKKGKVIGCHNWIYFAYAEKQKDLNYKGWMSKKDLGNKAKIVKIKFSINGLHKTVSSLFIGTSPELEIALYTICFKLRLNKSCKMGYDKVRFSILTHSFDHENKKYIGSAYVAL